MPRIDLRLLHQVLEPDDYRIVRRICDPKTWCVKRTRPKIFDNDAESRYVSYVWRMVAFTVSPIHDHHCLPVTAYFYLPKDADKELVQRLDALVDKVTSTVPKDQWYGILRWRSLYSTDGRNDSGSIKEKAKYRDLKGTPKKEEEHTCDIFGREACIQYKIEYENGEHREGCTCDICDGGI
jgi:hypothetical protein